MKKKLFSVLFALIILPCMFALTACGGNPPEDPHTHSWSSTYTKTATEHYKTCTGCDETSERANHTGNPCTVCGYETQTPHNHTQCPTCELCTDADCDGEESEKCQGHGPIDPGPVDPEHNHTACPTCGKCTDADCDGEATEKCEGHPQEPQEPVVTGNKYKDVTDKIISQMSTIKEVTMTVEYIGIATDGYLVWWGYNGNNFEKWKLGTVLTNTTNAGLIQAIEETTKANRFAKIDTYDSYYTMDNNAPLLISLKNKLVGSDYNIIVGGVSNVRGDALDADIGAYSIFDIDLLLEKNGIIYEYNDEIWASNGLQGKDVYQAVYQGTLNGTYKVVHSTIVELGDLAEDYYSEVIKTKTYKTLVDTIKTEMADAFDLNVKDIYVIAIDIKENKLYWWAWNGTNVVKYKLSRTLTEESDGSIAHSTIINSLTTALNPHFQPQETYVNYKTLTNDYTLVTNLKNKLVGENYNIIAGGIGSQTGDFLDGKLGAYSLIDVNFLLEKDGKIYEYNDSVMASNDLQGKDVYEAVYDGTKGNTYKLISEETGAETGFVELGDVAEDYWAKR